MAIAKQEKVSGKFGKERSGKICKLKRAKGVKDGICMGVEGVVWKARDGDGRTVLSDGEEECFSESFVYI